MKHKMSVKSLRDLNLLDRFLFDVSMEDSTILQYFLEVILEDRIQLLTLLQTEKELRTSPLLRSIRLDVYSMDERQKIYNTEAQKENTGNLPRRSRYYQSLIDSSLLEPGSINFNLLNDVCMIMIAPFDLFGRDKYKYTFQMICEEEEEIRLGDGATRIFLNTKGENNQEVKPELIELLHYVEDTTDQRAKSSKSEKIKEIHRRISKIKSSEEMGVRYMQAWEEKVMLKEEGRQEGKLEGKAEGQAEGKAGEIHIIRRKLEQGMETQQIAEWMELEEEYIKSIETLCRENLKLNDVEIAKQYLRGK